MTNGLNCVLKRAKKARWLRSSFFRSAPMLLLYARRRRSVADTAYRRGFDFGFDFAFDFGFDLFFEVADAIRLVGAGVTATTNLLALQHFEIIDKSRNTWQGGQGMMKTRTASFKINRAP